jgi:hypothetical protein
MKRKEGHMVSLGGILVDDKGKTSMWWPPSALPVDHEDKKNLVATRCPKIPKR